MSDFMLEVNDALRTKRLEAFWNRYGVLIIGIIVASVLATAAGVVWNSRMNSVLAADTDAYVRIMDATDDQTIIDGLVGISKTAHQPVKSLVDLTLAQKYEEAEKVQEAFETYGAIRKQTRVPETTQAVATLGYVRLGLTLDNADLDDLMAAIDPLTKDDKGFRPSALELKGLILQNQQKHAQANTLFKELSEDVTVPSTLRQRAKALIQHEAADVQK